MARPRRIFNGKAEIDTRGRYHGGRRPSNDDSFHSPTVIPPSALDKPSIMKRDHRRRTCSHTSPRRSPTMVTLHDTRFVECRWCAPGCFGKGALNVTCDAVDGRSRRCHRSLTCNAAGVHSFLPVDVLRVRVTGDRLEERLVSRADITTDHHLGKGEVLRGSSNVLSEDRKA